MRWRPVHETPPAGELLLWVVGGSGREDPGYEIGVYDQKTGQFDVGDGTHSEVAYWAEIVNPADAVGNDFELGDVVMLKSGGPQLVVDRLLEGGRFELVGFEGGHPWRVEAHGMSLRFLRRPSRTGIVG